MTRVCLVYPDFKEAKIERHDITTAFYYVKATIHRINSNNLPLRLDNVSINARGPEHLNGRTNNKSWHRIV